MRVLEHINTEYEADSHGQLILIVTFLYRVAEAYSGDVFVLIDGKHGTPLREAWCVLTITLPL